MRLLDLFCGAGGASKGYHRAGFDVVGIDIAPQPRYPFGFHQDDAVSCLDRMVNANGHATFTYPDGRTELLGLADFDAIHASPPCQQHTRTADQLAPSGWRPTWKPKLRPSMGMAYLRAWLCSTPVIKP